jgi:hypothetical protein
VNHPSGIEQHLIRSNMRRIRQTTPFKNGKPLTIRMMAKEIGSTPVFLSRFETGKKSKFNFTVVHQYADVLDLPVDVFCKRDVSTNILDVARRRFEQAAIEARTAEERLLVEKGKSKSLRATVKLQAKELRRQRRVIAKAIHFAETQTGLFESTEYLTASVKALLNKQSRLMRLMTENVVSANHLMDEIKETLECN